MYVLYTDDSILAGPSEKEIDQEIEDIKRVGLNINVEGDLQDFWNQYWSKIRWYNSFDSTSLDRSSPAPNWGGNLHQVNPSCIIEAAELP